MRNSKISLSEYKINKKLEDKIINEEKIILDKMLNISLQLGAKAIRVYTEKIDNIDTILPLLKKCIDENNGIVYRGDKIAGMIPVLFKEEYFVMLIFDNNLYSSDDILHKIHIETKEDIFGAKYIHKISVIDIKNT